MRRFSSFAKYEMERRQTNQSLPLPLVVPVGTKTLLSIPILTIIGVQVGVTV